MHVSDLNLLGKPDAEIARVAEDDGYVIVTKDADFATYPAIRVMRLSIGNASTPILLTWLERKVEGAFSRFTAGGMKVTIE